MVTAEEVRERFPKVRRVVVKVGTSNLTDERSRLDRDKVKKLVDEAMKLRRRGVEAIIVSSGAIGAGIGRLGLERRPKDMPSLQASAAVGQGILMQVYSEHFGSYGQPTAQMLLTREDFTDPRRYRNFRNTATTLLRWGVVPIVNENDSVEVEEIRLGDNDTLSALVAVGIRADLLIILSDVDGLYTGDPRKDARAELIEIVEKVTPKIERIAGKASPRGFGGMLTKVRAAKIASEAGIAVVIANGWEENVLERVIAGERLGTIFLPVRK